MSTKKLVWWGVALTLLGIVIVYVQWSLAVLYTVPCDGLWESAPGCRALAFRCEVVVVAPVPGLLMILAAGYRLIRGTMHARAR